jgi:hypothetical protein
LLSCTPIPSSGWWRTVCPCTPAAAKSSARTRHRRAPADGVRVRSASARDAPRAPARPTAARSA